MQGSLEYFVDQMINGITLGSIYGLIAIGYTMVYGIIGMINFAHGDIFMVGAFTALIVFLIQGPRNKPIPPMVSEVYNVAGISISLKQIIIVVVTAALLALFWYLVNRTALGRAQRACEQDRKMAALLGVDVDRTISITFIMGASLAAVAGTLFLMYYGVVSFSDGFVPGVKAFTAAVLGGIGSLPGAVLGGLLIGFIESMWSAYFSIDYKDVAAFSILAIVLIFMPSGILGRPEVEKV